MSDYKNDFENLVKEIEEQKVQRAKLEERLENLQKEEKQIQKDLKELDVTSDELEDVISKLEGEIKEEMEKCNKTLKI